jgi:hypothetical protein
LEHEVVLAIIVVSIVSGVWAVAIAPVDRDWTFFFLGLLLGPVGVLGAAVAQPRPKTSQAQPDRRTK